MNPFPPRPVAFKWELAKNIPEIISLYDSMPGFDMTLRDFLGDHSEVMLSQKAPVDQRMAMIIALEHMDKASKDKKHSDWDARMHQFRIWVCTLNMKDLTAAYFTLMETLKTEKHLFVQAVSAHQTDEVGVNNNNNNNNPIINKNESFSSLTLMESLYLTGDFDSVLDIMAAEDVIKKDMKQKPAQPTRRKSPPLLPSSVNSQSPPVARTITPPFKHKAMNRLVSMERPADDDVFPVLESPRSTQRVPSPFTWTPVFDNDLGPWPKNED